MSKLACKCGHVINLTPHPNQNEFYLFSEPLLEAILEEVASEYAKSTSAEDFEKRLYAIVFRGAKVPLVGDECSNCGRLFVFEKSTIAAPALVYSAEDVNGSRVLLQTLAGTISTPRPIDGIEERE